MRGGCRSWRRVSKVDGWMCLRPVHNCCRVIIIHSISPGLLQYSSSCQAHPVFLACFTDICLPT